MFILNTWLHDDTFDYSEGIRWWRAAALDPDQLGGVVEGWLMDWARGSRPRMVGAMLSWGVFFGLGFGAGLGLALHLGQAGSADRDPASGLQ